MNIVPDKSFMKEAHEKFRLAYKEEEEKLKLARIEDIIR